MRKYKYILWLGIALAAISLILAACGNNPAPTKPPPVQEPTKATVSEATATKAPEASPTAGQAAEATATTASGGGEVTTETGAPVIPNLDEWTKSPHNDEKAEPFNHWNAADPKEIPVGCAKCHSTQGYQDYVGADGSAVYKVDKAVPAPAGTIQCIACHNAATASLTAVEFPYTYIPEGKTDPVHVTITGLGAEARCMVCHQGVTSKAEVDKAIADFGLIDDLDKVAQPQGDKQFNFINIHYRAAAATLYGTETKSGYEYTGKRYDAKFDHVQGVDNCVACHNPHTLEVKVEKCQGCHTNVKTKDDLQNIRMMGSLGDYNGNGDTKEGIAAEIKGLQASLMTNIQAYAKEVAQKPIVYSENVYPYYFLDTNGDGKASDDETKAANKFNAWTGRLIKAAYNYQMSVKDPGAFAHNGKYIIELLYDSIADLNEKVTAKVDMSKMRRIDNGHFAGSEEPFRHWDAQGMVPGTCAKCHSATGLPTFLAEAAAASDKVSGVNIAADTANGLNCATCHDDLSKFTRRVVDKVKFPSAKIVSFGEGMDANLCIECHQGRESKVSVDAAIQRSGAKDDQISDKLSFRNPHYFAAGATLFGTDAQGAYEYTGQKYNGRFMHEGKLNMCVNCHDVHALNVKIEVCSGCHGTQASQEDLKKIRGPNTKEDFNGNGNATEGMGEEVAGMQAELLKAINAYVGKTKGAAKITYDPAAYPYFFADDNGNGKVDEGEKAYATWTPRLLKGAYNYQWVQKDPGAFAHNGKYIIQILYDTIKDLGGNVSKMTRPAVTAAPTQ